MVSCAVLILCPLWIQSLVQACKMEELPREVVLSWFRERVLEGLGLEEPLLTTVRGPERDTEQMDSTHVRVHRTSRSAWEHRETSSNQDISQIILFPTYDSSCALADSETNGSTNSVFTFYFQPSINYQDTTITSAHFWFFAGRGNSSTPLLILTSDQQLFQGPSEFSSDGWTTYHVDGRLLPSEAQGQILLQVHCRDCECHTNNPDKMPFLHLHVQSRGPIRSSREAAVTIPWSPSATYLLQRPSQERPEQDDCRREEIEISFEELGWDNWIVHPKVLTFYYCHGNCSARDRTTAMLGIPQCCAPVPGTMKSLEITTTSDGGYSYKYETLPNIIPEECTCI